MNLKIISAGAGSGKTHRLTSEMVELLASGKVKASGIIATTFTNKAAAELQERVRVRLLEEGLTKEADELTNALIGTVHGLGVRLLKRFAFEAGVSPEVDIIADEDQQVLFNQSLATVLTNERVEEMERLSNRLGLTKSERYKTDWRRVLKNVTEVARANDFGKEVLEKSKVLSFESFAPFFGEVSDQKEEDFSNRLTTHLSESIAQLEGNDDATKVTAKAVSDLKNLREDLQLRGELYWHQWVKISKIKVGAKSRDEVAELQEFAAAHDSHPAFHEDVRSFLFNIFDLAVAAIEEYDNYKKHRGLIDYTDMEVHVKKLLDQELVREVLSKELDLLMVDEFQDTSPIQLEIFLKLSKFAGYSVWVGDPKQSIYGFRGADPELMQTIIEMRGGVKPEDIQEYSWRSREDIVFVANALFTKAFSTLPKEQIALKPKRRKIATSDSLNDSNEPPDLGDALQHWHFQYDGEGRLPGRPWMENCIASSIQTLLKRGLLILPKGEKKYRPAQAGDIAILCRSNNECLMMAEALHRAGLKAAIARSGLLGTAESKLILACLKFILNKYDSLSIAEILLLAARLSIEDIIEDRLDYLEKLEIQREKNEYLDYKWGEQNDFIQQLNELRGQVVELSGTEILNLLLEELDLRRIIVSWGNVEQRLANVDVFRKLALQYEEACNRLHSAASLGGFLLWLGDMEKGEKDLQGSGESPDAVNVLTYHKSKGLEWPIVLCHSLEQNLREDVWGMAIVPEKEKVDLDNILGNRWLRYWVNPYADQFRGTRMEGRINESSAKADARKRALEEEARLLYVGITRARDYLIFPTRKMPTKWLNRVWQEGNEDYPTLVPEQDSPWEWEDKYLKVATEIFPHPRDFPHAETKEENSLFLEIRAGREAHQPYIIDLNKERLNGEFTVKTAAPISYAPPVFLKEDQDKYSVAKVMKAFLTADSTAYDLVERIEMAAAFLERYEIEEMLDAKSLLKFSSAYLYWQEEHFQIKNRRRKFPVRIHRNGRLFEAILDLVLETDEGLVVIQNSGFAGDLKAAAKHAKERLADWLFLSKLALQQIFEGVKIRTMVHFVLNGAVVELEMRRVSQNATTRQ